MQTLQSEGSEEIKNEMPVWTPGACIQQSAEEAGLSWARGQAGQGGGQYQLECICRSILSQSSPSLKGRERDSMMKYRKGRGWGDEKIKTKRRTWNP